MGVGGSGNRPTDWTDLDQIGNSFLTPMETLQLCNYAVNIEGGSEMGFDGREMGVGGPTHQ